MKEKIRFCFVAAFLLVFSRIGAQPGTLDPAFGNGGLVIHDNADGDDDAKAVAVQPDGKIVVAGAVVQGSYQYGLVRYMQDGSLDASFGVGGISVAPNNTLCYAYDMRLQPDGKILVTGNSNGYDPNDVYLTMRFNSDGSVDQAFGSNGRVYTKIYGSDDRAKAVAVQPDGKIIIGGIAWNGADYDIGLARLSAQGKPDSTFGTNGIVITDLNHKSNEVESLSILSDGKILVAGTQRSETAPFEKIMLVRYRADGTPDSGFGGGDGFVLEPLGGCKSHLVQPDGKIVLAGSGSNGGLDFLLYRFLPDGALDNTFGTGGKVFTHFGYDDDYGNDIVMDAEGRLLVCGDMLVYPGPQTVFPMLCARYLPDGTLDASFDGDGRVLIEIDGRSCGAKALSVQADGKIILAGTSVNDFATVRLRENGVPDPGFGIQGRVVTPVGNGADACRALHNFPDGSMLLAGFSTELLGYEFSMAKFKADGTRDLDFGKKGTVLLSTYYDNFGAYAVGIQSDGKILLGGYHAQSSSAAENFAVLRFTPQGTPDSSFGTAGMSIVSLLDGDDRLYALTVLPDDRILLAGLASSATWTAGDFALAQLLPNGAPDPGFGQNGKLIKSLSNSPEQLFAVKKLPDGKILAAGTTLSNGTYILSVFRFTANGAPDPSFGPAGTGVTSMLNFDMPFDADQRMIIQPDGKIVVAGQEHIGSSKEFALARFLPNGTPDAGFGANGKLVFNLGDGESQCSALGWQNGYLVAAGTMNSGGVNTLITARLDATGGAPDAGYGANGFSALQVGGASTRGNCLSLGAGNSITVAGTYSLNNGQDFLLARFLGPVVSAPTPLARALRARVFPNPASDFIHVEFDLPETSFVCVSLTDACGKQLLKTDLEQQFAGLHTATIGLPSGLSAGLYVIQIRTRFGLERMQLVVQ